MKLHLPLAATLFAAILLSIAVPLDAADQEAPIRAGIIGLDTSHVIAFTKVLTDPKAPAELKRVKIVAAYPGGSRDLPASWDRVPQYTQQVRAMGVEIVGSIGELTRKVDAVLLESVDGRPHLAQARPVIAAGKPLFIDKPLAASLADGMQIFRLAKEKNVPCFSASSLRFSSGFQAARSGRSPFGKVRSCVAWSPMHLEPHHPDLFWYGIHGVETLFTVMGPGCKMVRRIGPDKVLGLWKDGRLGMFVAANGYGAVVQGTKKSGDAGTYEGYEPLVKEIVKFFETGKPPVSAEETLEILAFMEAADQSKLHGGAPVEIETVMKAAERKISQESR